MFEMRKFNFNPLIDIVFKEESHYYKDINISIINEGFTVVGMYEKQYLKIVPIITMEYDRQEGVKFYSENKNWLKEKLKVDDKEKIEEHIKKWYDVKSLLTSTLRYEVGQISRSQKARGPNTSLINLNYALREVKNENEMVILSTRFPVYINSFLNKAGKLDFLEFDSKNYKDNHNISRMKNEEEFAKMMRIFSFKLLYG
jgi:hypothetical protein